MQLTISHKTSYAYDMPVDFALQKLRLRPLTNTMQDVDDWQIDVIGGQIEASYLDHYGNHTDLVSVTPGATAVDITARGHVTTHDKAGVLGTVYGRAPLWHFAQSTHLTAPGAGVREFARTLGKMKDPLASLHDLSNAIRDALPYRTGVTGADTTAEQAIKIGAGVCQDHAQIFISAARTRGVPARYVGGYLMINDIVDQDAAHAWAEAHIEGLGWVGFDVSNGVAPDEKYVRVATGRDASCAAPVKGMRKGPSNETLIVSLQVQQ
ncbi:transglutaminase family protein [Yoonia vestfoldensis]|uniref:transglutaminase family protein n=1 Tax=Yoonia vestfoldensis TaxID=245188 RepID=UPI0003667A84|nr:transglutaminase family protein [Yoonia vestfoldensis]